MKTTKRCQNCDQELKLGGVLPDGSNTADGKGPYCWGCLGEAQEVEDRNAIEK